MATTKTSTTNTAGLTPDQMRAYALKTGLTAAQYAQLDPSQQAVIAIIGETASNLYSTGSTGVTVSDALARAAADPSIISKYSDALNLDKEQFTQSIQQLQQSADITAKNQENQFHADRKSLDDSMAAAGAAYSGFRGQAQKKLTDSENGVITSTRATIKNNVNNLTSAFEAKYGSGATTPAAITYTNPLNALGNDTAGGKTYDNGTVTGDKVGGVTGSAPVAKNQDVTSLASTFYQDAQSPLSK